MKRAKQNPLVSIIVPVYNAEMYLEQCVDSLLQQTYQNVEIILVDDGSTDRSGNMCDIYAEKESRVKVYHQENSGQAVARNVALTVAEGDYVIYVDSDDYVRIDYVEKLLELVFEYRVDIIQCYAQKFWENGKAETLKIKENKVQIYTASEALREFCYQRKFYAGPCAKIIRKELMEGLEFPSNMGYEDLAIMYRLIGKASRIALAPEVMYFYRQHINSTMHTVFSDKKVDRIRIAEEMKSYIEQNYPENRQAMKTRYLLANLQLLMDLPYEKKYKELRQQIQNNIKSVRKDVMKDEISKRSIRIMALVSYLGMPSLMILGRVYKMVFS